MAAELKDTLNFDAELIRGGGGIFDVALEGNILYSKKQTGRFPNPGEVPAAIESHRNNE